MKEEIIEEFINSLPQSVHLKEGVVRFNLQALVREFSILNKEVWEEWTEEELDKNIEEALSEEQAQ